jgi:hypothetical protein
VFVEYGVGVLELCLCDPLGVVGVVGLSMAIKFMCMLLGSQVKIFVQLG